MKLSRTSQSLRISGPLVSILLLAAAVFGWQQQSAPPPPPTAVLSAIEREAVANIRVETKL